MATVVGSVAPGTMVVEMEEAEMVKGGETEEREGSRLSMHRT